MKKSLIKITAYAISAILVTTLFLPGNVYTKAEEISVSDTEEKAEVIPSTEDAEEKKEVPATEDIEEKEVVPVVEDAEEKEVVPAIDDAKEKKEVPATEDAEEKEIIPATEDTEEKAEVVPAAGDEETSLAGAADGKNLEVSDSEAADKVVALDEKEDAEHTITYILYDGENNPENPDSYSEETEVVFKEAVKAGYTFEGWFADAAMTKKLESTMDCKKDLVLYAKWTATVYSITYVNNGATTEVYYPESYVVTTPTFVLKIPKKTGFTFEGWYTDPDFDENTKVDRIYKGSMQDITLYAKWAEFTYSIRYMPNGGAGDIKTVSGLDYSKYYYLSACPYTRNGYSFVGWSTKPSRETVGAVFYEPKSYVTKLSAQNKGIFTLYAQWQLNRYTITYNLNDRPDTPAANNRLNPAEYTINSSVLFRNPERKGYTFGGWYTTPDFKEGSKITKISKSTGDISIYAKWSENSYKLAYKINGGKFVSGFIPSGETHSYTGVVNFISASKVEPREGYTFEGWSTTTGNSGTLYAPGSSTTKLYAKNNATLTLYGRWKLIDYPVTYELYGGVQPTDVKGMSKNPSTYTYAEVKNLLAPTKKGYTFLGWYKSPSFEPESKMIRIPRYSTGEVKLYAKWRENVYTLSYSPNRGSFKAGEKPVSTVYSYNEDVLIVPASALNERAGYVFTGWNTKADGRGVTYAPGTRVSRLRDADRSTITLYAMWTPVR